MECNNGDLKFELSEVLNSFKVETERTALAVATKTKRMTERKEKREKRKEKERQRICIYDTPTVSN